MPIDLVEYARRVWNTKPLDAEAIKSLESKIQEWAKSHLGNIAEAVACAVMNEDMKNKGYISP